MGLAELVDGLPPWLAIVLIVVVGVVGAIIKFGYAQGGREAEGGGRSSAAVAAVIVDPTALNRLTDQVAQVVSVLDRIARAGEGVSESEEKLAEELSRLREEIRVSVVQIRR